jgi:NADH dehydrogenase (ubiquinone) Fe-S protein 3
LNTNKAFRNFDTSTPWESVGEGRIDTPETFKLPTPGPDPKEQEEKDKAAQKK